RPPHLSRCRSTIVFLYFYRKFYFAGSYSILYSHQVSRTHDDVQTLACNPLASEHLPVLSDHPELHQAPPDSTSRDHPKHPANPFYFSYPDHPCLLTT